MRPMQKKFTNGLLLAFAILSWSQNCHASEPVDFSLEVLPILSDRCFHCHGPDESDREADLRLDLRASAVDEIQAIVPGNSNESELLVRISSDDPDLLMPPADSHRPPLSKSEIATLRNWIDTGAEWGRHWAFERPRQVAIDEANSNPIDYFIRRKLMEQGFNRSPPADKTTLIRRVSFDLTGLPPTLSEVETFLADDSPHAFPNLVDHLMQSSHYGERMAMWWLDAARYSDTDGYQQDATRTNWPWRDWVTDAFNSNMKFDQFTIEQFAGDLLSDSTPEQKLATCFHRNHMLNGEGGRDPEESRVDYVIDRVNTMGTVWLGLTLGCAQCHSHKFDPISQQDYYSLTSFFNSIDEDGKAGGNAKPNIQYHSSYAKRSVSEAEKIVSSRAQTAESALATAKRELDDWITQQISRVKGGFEPWQSLQPTHLESVEGTVLELKSDGTIQATGPNPRQDDYKISASYHQDRITGFRLEVFPDDTHTDGKLSRGKHGEFVLTNVKLLVRQKGHSQLREIDISGAIADFEKTAKGRAYGNVRDTLDDDPRNGWTTETAEENQRHVAVFALAEPLNLNADEELIFVLMHRSTVGDANIGRFRISVTDQPGKAVRSLDPMPLQELATLIAGESIADENDLDPDENPDENPSENPSDKIGDELQKQLLDQFLEDHLLYQQKRIELERAKRQLSEFKNADKNVNVMVLAEKEEPRKTHLLIRGVWDKHGEEVPRGVPQAILPWPNEKTTDRLGLAQWIVSSENPLTARVVVNQLWQLCFGAGLVQTPEDFGLQGERPTHPELLDWLAVEFIEHDWDLQHILRLIVTSETYQQSSDTSSELLERDPKNKLLARGARFRLPSWMIRDAVLRSSGLLNGEIGGPPIRPYQPKGVWSEMFMGRFQYEPSQGPSQYRRTLYAFWRRSATPTFLFDSSQRRVCEVRPRRTNTPLHALTLLNDLSQLEASREIARKVIAEKPNDLDRLTLLFQTVASRVPTQSELTILQSQLRKASEYYVAEMADAKLLLDFGQPEKRDLPQNNPAQLASFMVVASMIYNLDEVITHE